MAKKKEIRDMEIQDALEYTEHIINTVHDPLVILFEDLRVALASRSFYETFQVTAEETEGKFIYDLGNQQWDIPSLRHLLEDILPQNSSFDHFEIGHNFPNIGKRAMSLNACRFYMEADRTKLIVITFKDITEDRKADKLRRKIAELESQLREKRTR